MEFYEPSSVQLHGVTRFDPDLSPALLPNVDRYGFVGNHKQASESSQTVDVDVFRQREIKWLEMLGNWDKWINKKFPKVKERCRKGIPSSVRGRAWQKLSGSFTLLNQNSGVFDDLVQRNSAEWENMIEKDLSRTFPFHEMFSVKGGPGQRELFNILKAYSIYDSKTGYCQAMAPVAAVLLMHMTAEEAFWCLVMICDKYIPGYYSPKLVSHCPQFVGIFVATALKSH